MRRFLAARLLQSLIVVLLVTTISFFLVRLSPGDPFAYEGRGMSPAIRAHWRAQFGYDRPIPEQFVRYVSNVARGNLGYSHTLQRPVREALAIAVPRTLLLAAASLLLAFLIGVTVGALQAVKKGTRFDRVATTVLLFFYSVPDFWLALMVLLTFAYWLPLFPIGGLADPVMYAYMGPWEQVVDRLRHMVLPAFTLALLTAAGIARFQRSALLDVLPLEFVRTARAKGVSEAAVIRRHALRNALLPIVTMLGLMLPALLGGALFVEYVFNWPGMGLLMANAIGARDYDLVTAGVIMGAVLVTIGSVLSDVLYRIVDPRMRGS